MFKSHASYNFCPNCHVCKTTWLGEKSRMPLGDTRNDLRQHLCSLKQRKRSPGDAPCSVTLPSRLLGTWLLLTSSLRKQDAPTPLRFCCIQTLRRELLKPPCFVKRLSLHVLYDRATLQCGSYGHRIHCGLQRKRRQKRWWWCEAVVRELCRSCRWWHIFASAISSSQPEFPHTCTVVNRLPC